MVLWSQEPSSGDFAEDPFYHSCEAVFNTHKKVFRTALVGVGAEEEKQPVLCIELEKQLSDGEQKQLIAELKDIAQKHEMTKCIHQFLIHPQFPVDIRHNAKIFREKLSSWAEERLS
ncbi:hypothetical protein [uncultured Desulfuromusa sp.]|uniref:hypothetical protein n=1 Tax=uncultured Desulfuromusa sp. TaxID=219183 RepID=UPI002AA5E8DD|nr:hypothetical protein [uncultured Desulfuromusa sp.]